MARFRGALVLLCAYSFLISGSLSTTVNLVNWNSPICFNGTVPDTKSCTNYYTCTNPIMTWLQAFFQWTKNTWWNSFNYTTGTCSLYAGSWETSFFMSNSKNLNSVLPNLGSMIGKKRIRRKRQVPLTVQGVLAPLLSSLLSSGELTQKSTASLTCSGSCTGNQACFFDDLHHDCRTWDLLNPNRQTACGPTTTTTSPPPGTPSPPPVTTAKGIGITVPSNPTTAAPTTAAPTTTASTTTTTPATTTLEGTTCDQSDAGENVCDGCDAFHYCQYGTYTFGAVTPCGTNMTCFDGMGCNTGTNPNCPTTTG